MRHLLKLLALPALLLALPAAADEGVHIVDPYARILTTGAGIVYFTINNHSAEADTLISVQTDIGGAMLMTSAEDASGVMKMTMVMEGFAVGAGESHALQPAGDHIMLMDLTTEPGQGESFQVILTFAHAGEVALSVPVDNTRRTAPGMGPTPFDVLSGEAD